ncbi:hypothetical protein EI77_03701 [Prosthecobacter fusiformis]|uniref:HTTM domain-containing protein n=2 Tax=Prosthecobacter fusiformis TaxID=48464 RepID=A0A4R7RPM7_9BACT|nr:hypothetical protein EI77_03701 [Prosthecobacter fusiformis]
MILAMLQTLAAVLLVFGMYRLFRAPVGGWLRADYDSSSFLFSALLKNVTNLSFWGSMLLAAGFAWANRKQRAWGELLPGGRMHWVVAGLIVVLAWTGGLYPYNFFFGQAHWMDRTAILLLGLAAWRLPAFFPLLLYAVMVSYLQWRVQPLTDAEFTNRKLVLDMAWVLCAAGLARPVIQRWLPRAVYAGTLALLNACLIHYWIPGLAKLKIGMHHLDWLMNDELFNLTASTCVYGWTAFWNQEQLSLFLETVVPFGLPLKLFVLIVELALVTAFWSRRWFVCLSLGRVMLHAGIFVCSGDSFWNWILLQLAVTMAFVEWPSRKKDLVSAAPETSRTGPAAPVALPFFSWQTAIVAAASLLLTANSHMASNLAWFDSQLTERYNFYAVMQDGRRLYINPDFFEPYEFAFIQSQFHYFHEKQPEKILTRTFGAIHDAKVAQEVRQARTPEQMRLMIDKHGKEVRDPKRVAAFSVFLNRWFSHYWTWEGQASRTLHFLSPPLHAYVLSKAPPEQTYHGEKGVLRIQIEFERTFFDGQNFREMDKRIVHEVSLTDPASTRSE